MSPDHETLPCSSRDSVRTLTRCALIGCTLLLLGLTAARADQPAAEPAVVAAPLAPGGQDQIGERPTAQHAWISGHWRWQDGHYVWMAGHWELPPRSDVVWVEPRWEARGGGYALTDGFWQETSSAATSAGQETPATAAPVVQMTSPSTVPVSTATVVEGQEVVVSEPPPPPPVTQEVVVAQPSAQHVWVAGHWHLRDGRYWWIAGHWDLPPRSNMVWVAARYERRGNRYVFVEGGWHERSVVVTPAPALVVREGPAEVVIGEAPPAPRYEVRGAPPSGRHMWIAGYWAWRNGRHEWIGGHWELPPHGRTHWEPAHYERRGNGFIFIEGFWR